MRSRPVVARALILVTVVALAMGCTKTATVTETGGASGSGSTTPSGTAATTTPGATAPTPSGTTPPTTCVSAPATTGVGTKGGGEIICSSPDDSSVSSPPMTDTTIPEPSTTIAQPDATHGVSMVITGGSPCPKSAEMCVAMFQIVPAELRFERTDGTGSASATTGGMNGMISIKLDPGRWRVTAKALSGDRECATADITITAGETTSTSIDCSLPG